MRSMLDYSACIVFYRVDVISRGWYLFEVLIDWTSTSIYTYVGFNAEFRQKMAFERPSPQAELGERLIHRDDLENLSDDDTVRMNLLNGGPPNQGEVRLNHATAALAATIIGA